MGFRIGDAVRSKDGAMSGTVQGLKFTSLGEELAIVQRSDSGTLCAISVKDAELDASGNDRVKAYWLGQRVFVPAHRSSGSVEDPTHSDTLGGKEDVVVLLDTGKKVMVSKGQLYPLHEADKSG